jgi:hypothetical protein
MRVINATNHVSISRLEQLAGPAMVPDSAERSHLAACIHCHHILRFFSGGYIGRRVSKDGSKRLADFDKTA